MTSVIRLPVVFNVLTIVAMLFAMFQVIAGASGPGTRTAEVIQLLEGLANDGVLEDDTLVPGLYSDQEMRSQLDNYLMVTMAIAIVANFIANYLGRGRHHSNLSRIRELEAELRVLREG